MAEPAQRPESGRRRDERLETRVTADQKRLIERAAALQGRTVTDFVLSSV
ncbi:MAG: ribbon-helix-helix protein, partial [Caulobacter sp.]|nr:ribbon-helix-helix protein [Caulobacter sp.]